LFYHSLGNFQGNVKKKAGGTVKEKKYLVYLSKNLVEDSAFPFKIQ